jgi:CelD/BcsL family acetyltransferase involved in cellulose biosynthesis
MSRAVGSSLSRISGIKARATRPRKASARGPKLTAKWTTLAKLAADPAAWQDLAGRALEPNIFLEPDFARAALAAELGGVNIGVIAVREGTRLVGLLPGRVRGLTSARPVSAFVAWTHPYAPLSTPLVDRDLSVETVDAMFAYLPRLPGAPRVASFPLVSEDGPIARLLAEHAQHYRFGVHERAALMAWRAGAVTASPGKLKELRRQRRRLGELGELAVRTVASPEGAQAAIVDYLNVEAAGWKGRAGDAILADARATQFFTQSVTSLIEKGKARVDVLTLDGRTLAAAVTLLSGDRAWFWKTAYDETFARFSPGVQLALDLTDALAKDERITLVDSCAIAGHPMIDQLWGGRIAIADWLMPLAGQASFAAAIAAEQLRRAVISGAKAVRGRLRD